MYTKTSKRNFAREKFPGIYLLIFLVALGVILSPAQRTNAESTVSTENPWQSAAGSPTGTNIGYNYAMGYHFTPLTDGYITELGGYFNGAKTVRLFNKTTGAVLAETTVNASDNWSYTAITPVPVDAGVQYTVAVYLAGSGASQQSGVTLPITSGNIRIDARTHVSTVGNPNARPTNEWTSTMYGQADVTFSSDNSGGELPDSTTPWQDVAPDPAITNIDWNYAMGYNFTPETDGFVTALGGFFNGTKTVRLFDRSTYELLAETTVTASNNWGYTQISPVAVAQGVQYTVAVYLAGSGASLVRDVSYPLVSGGIRIDSTVFGNTSSDPNALPINSSTNNIMYGQVDVAFSTATSESSVCDGVTEIPVDECLALVALYESTNGDNWDAGAGWLEDNTPCDWNGVSCSSGRVNRLNLEEDGLDGPIPAEIGNLTALEFFSVADNEVTALPSEIGQLTSLITLDISSNRVTVIPAEIGNLTSLETLAVRSNGLTSLPPEIGNLTSLKVLLVNNTDLITFPPAMGNLTSLETLIASSNGWTTLPTPIWTLTSLRSLDVRNNEITEIPGGIENLSVLESLNISNNPDLADLPNAITNISLLQRLFYSNTNVCIPDTAEFRAWYDAIPTTVGNGYCLSEPSNGTNPWQEVESDAPSTNIGWDYAMGYNFTPETDGAVTALGGFFNGTKTVRLFNYTTGTLLAEATVTASNNWEYTQISPVAVAQGVQYTVAVYLSGTGASFVRNVSYPMVSGGIRIDGTTYANTSSDPNVRPTYNITNSTMYGQADIEFTTSASGGSEAYGSLPYNQVETRTDDLGAGSAEFSGVTFNQSNGRMVIVDDGDVMHEINLDSNLSPAGSRRTLSVNIGGDTEGIAWMYNNTYAVVSENLGRLYIIDLPDDPNLTSVNSSHVIHEINTQIPETDGSGLEGVAFDFNSASGPSEQSNAVFYVIDEKPPAMYRVTWNGSRTGPVTVPTVSDASDIYAAPSGSIYVISDESRRIVELDVNSAFTTATVASSQSLPSNYSQPEGITFNSDLSTMLVVSEKDNNSANVTFGRFDGVLQ